MAQDFPRHHSKPLCSASLIQLPSPASLFLQSFSPAAQTAAPRPAGLQASVQAMLPSQSTCLSFIPLLHVRVRESQCRPGKKQAVLPVLLLLLLIQSRLGSLTSKQHIGSVVEEVVRGETRGKFILIIDKLANKICLHTSF